MIDAQWASSNGDRARAHTKPLAPPKIDPGSSGGLAKVMSPDPRDGFRWTPILTSLAKTSANTCNDGDTSTYALNEDIVHWTPRVRDLDWVTDTGAAEQGRVVKGDPEPEKGFYYRSDHFNFAVGAGTGSDNGIDYAGPGGYGQKVRDDYTEHRYHRRCISAARFRFEQKRAEDLKLFFAAGFLSRGAGRHVSRVEARHRIPCEAGRDAEREALTPSLQQWPERLQIPRRAERQYSHRSAAASAPLRGREPPGPAPCPRFPPRHRVADRAAHRLDAVR